MAVPNTAICKWLIFFSLLIQSFTSKAQLAADFSATPLTGCAPLLVNFTDLSTGNPTNWKWDLGNGTISYLKNPAVTYFAPGQYNIKLVITNASGAAEIVKNQLITVYAVPVVNFSGSPIVGCFPLKTTFTDESKAGSGTISKWEWDFGDGNLSSTQSPTHTYLSAGNFNVSLRVTNSFGCVTTNTKSQYIQVGIGAKAAFTYTAAGACTVPSTVTFNNSSTGSGALSYKWDFGDGGTSTLQNPSHTYTAGGTYSVKLIVLNPTGCTDTIIKTNAITIGSVKANFSLPVVICEGSAFTINNTSAPVPSTVNWNFGDGTTSTSASPSKTFNSTGTYIIKMVAGFGACSDSLSTTVTVLPKPTVTFSADKTSSCSPPLTVNFTTSGSAGSIYLWSFGDGSTSTVQNPSHTYSTYGNFDVKLVTTNAAGCTDSLLKPAYIKVQSLGVSIPGLPAKECAPFTFAFNANINSTDPIVSYLWYFGDGSTSTQASPTHTFNTGKYTISVIVKTANGCTDTATVVDGIQAGNKPKVNFSAAPRDVCAKIPVEFTDLTTGEKPDKWLWFFGDGTTSTDQNPNHAYQDTGYFDVTLIVWNNGCSDTLKMIDYVHISPPIAIFSVDFDCGAPYKKTFNDHSIGADTWFWDFGDGTTSTLQNPPVHIYSKLGAFPVTLTVTNFKTGCSFSQTQTVINEIERADFKISDTTICKGGEIELEAVNINNANVASYYWKYGDGTEGFDNPKVKHIYNIKGTYSITLVITSILGCKDSIVKQIKVDKPTAAFKSSRTGICVESEVLFNDNSTAGAFPIEKWIWNFGDGITQTYTSGPFKHIYTTPGVYPVTLTVIDSEGCTDSIVETNASMISKPIADFSTTDTMSCKSKMVTFTNLSTGPNLTYNWGFGDGTTSTDINPSHTYTKEGIFNITLTITDQYGCTDKITKNNYLTIADPVADFALSDTVSTCPPLVITFTDLSKNVIKRSWDFGDGTSSVLQNPTHFYSTPGVFNIILTLTGYNGCVITKTKQVIVRGPQGSFSYTNITGCNPLKTDFVGRTSIDISFIWDFNDGATLSTPDSVVSHTYTNPGMYLPKMILKDKAGCQVPIMGTDTIRVYGIKADFETNITTLCDSGYVSFTEQSFSNDIITSYLWNFGDGKTSTQQNPVHSFNKAGVYNTLLKVTTKEGCTDTVSAPTPIRIIAGPRIAINSNSGVCIPATINFKGELLQPDTSALSWKWNFGNGQTSTLQNPSSQRYLFAGLFTVEAVATNSNGCKDSVTKVIETYPLPLVIATADTTICLAQTVQLKVTGAASYTWYPSVGLSSDNIATPVAKPDSNTIYSVKGISSQGCISWDTVQLSVRRPFKMEVSRGDTLCIGKSINLAATGAHSYVWYPATGLSNIGIANPVATPRSTTNYMVVGKDDKGCFTDSAYVPLRVYPIPKVDAGADKTINVGQTLDLDPTLSSDVTATTWSPTSGIFRNRFPGITVKPPLTTEYTVEVVNEGGCKARDKVTVYVLCNNANVFIPNTFSPNGDGSNDIFYPRGTGVYSIKTLRVFNRWGEVVFEKTNFNANDVSAGWDGTYKGKKLNPDVFVYTVDIMCENNTILNYKGNVALIL